MNKRLNIRRTVKVYSEYDICNLGSFLKELNTLYNNIPVEYRQSAIIEVDKTSDYYDVVNVTIEISYVSPETDHEMAKRKKLAEERSLELKERELSLLKKLKDKYNE